MFPDHHYHHRPWRKPVAYFINRLFNFDPYRDFGILDEVVGILLVVVTIAISVYTSHGATKPYKFTDKNFAQGSLENVVVANDGTLRLESGQGWVRTSSVGTDTMRALTIRGGIGGAVGDLGSIGGWNGSNFYVQVFFVGQEQPTTDDLYGVAATPSGELWAVGDAGTIIRRSTNGVWSLLSPEGIDTNTNLRGISFLGDEAIIVGTQGTIVQCTSDSTCTAMDGADTTTSWNAVSCAGNACWAAGNGGRIATCSTSGCTLETATPGVNLYGVDAVDDTNVTVVGSGGTILMQKNGAPWEQTNQGAQTLRGVAMENTGARGFAIGDSGTIFAYNGTAWAKESSPTQRNLHSVALTATGDAWAVGVGGTFVRYGTNTVFADNGVFESRILTLDHPIDNTTITWDATIPRGTTLRFQVASSASASTDPANWVYEEPASAGGDQDFVPNFYEVSGNKLSTVHNGKRYLRYKAYFIKGSDEKTPVLRSVSFTTNTTVIDAPTLTDPKQNAILSTQPTFSWSAVTGADAYILRVSRDTACTNVIETQTKEGTSGVIDGALSDGKYYWCVKTIQGETTSDWSSVRSFTIDTTPPAAPTLRLPASSAQLFSAPKTFDWTDVASATRYTLMLDDSESFDSPIVSEHALTQSAYTLRTALEPGTYSWRVRAIDAAGLEGQWATNAFTIKVKGDVQPPSQPPEPPTPPEPPPPPPPPPPPVDTPPTAPPQTTTIAGENELANALRKTIGRATEVTTRIIRENQTSVKIGLSVAVPVVTIANPAVVATFPNIHTLLYHFISWVLSLFGIRKRRKPWGIVYNAITKDAVPLAIVRIFNAEKKLIETQVTDAHGRFGFLTPQGTYTIEVTKPEFLFPSKLVGDTDDGDYTHCYYGTSFTLKTANDLIDVAIPLDPRDPRLEQKRSFVWYAVKRALKKIALPILIVGTILAWLATLVVASPFNVSMLVVYLFFLVYEIIVAPRTTRPWGTVFDAASTAPVPLAVVSLIETRYNRVLKTRLSDYFGRFTFLPSPGEYRIVVKKEGYRFPAQTEAHIRRFRHPYYGNPITVRKEGATMNIDIPVQRKV